MRGEGNTSFWSRCLAQLRLAEKLSLRAHLILAFFTVSVIPVLVASYIAATTIQDAFQSNLSNWLEEAVRFLATEVAEARDESAKAAGIVAGALHAEQTADNDPGQEARVFAELLTSVGYDVVTVYDDTGKVAMSSGVKLTWTLPQQDRSGIVVAERNGAPTLMVASSHSFDWNGKRQHVIVANIIDDDLFGITRALSSLDVQVYRVIGGKAVPVSERPDRPAQPVADRIVEKLGQGESSDTNLDDNDSDETLAAFAPLRDENGQLVGIVAGRLAGTSALFESLGQWGIFAGLASVSALVALGVALLMSHRIARPVRALTHGVSAISGGDYAIRVEAEGGREIGELAAGFNSMAEQLERLRAMESEMRKRSQFAALGEAAAVIAHEIRNPLGIIKTSSEVVRMKSKLGPSEARLVGFVLDEVDRIDRLVQDMLEYVRPNEMRRDKLDLNALVTRAFEVCGPSIAHHKAEARLQLASGPLMVEGDRDRLHQVFLNLIVNALEAMEDGGTIAVTTGKDKIQAVVRFSDTGRGMSQEVRERIFDPFFTTKTRGTGLGLAKVQSIIEELGGKIVVTSQSGEGAQFTLSLPLAN